MKTPMGNAPNRLEPRWPAMLALLAVGGLRLALPESLSVGPDWLFIAVVAVLMIPTVWARRRELDKLNKILGYVVTSIVMADMIWSLGLLTAALPYIKNHLTICCVPQRHCGSQIHSSAHLGTGGLMRGVPAPVSCAAFTPTEPFCFLRKLETVAAGLLSPHRNAVREQPSFFQNGPATAAFSCR